MEEEKRVGGARSEGSSTSTSGGERRGGEKKLERGEGEGGGGKGKRADRGIIIKRDISYVGGRIVSATRHARRFCVPAVRARALRP